MQLHYTASYQRLHSIHIPSPNLSIPRQYLLGRDSGKKWCAMRCTSTSPTFILYLNSTPNIPAPHLSNPSYTWTRSIHATPCIEIRFTPPSWYFLNISRLSVLHINFLLYLLKWLTVNQELVNMFDCQFKH